MAFGLIIFFRIRVAQGKLTLVNVAKAGSAGEKSEAKSENSVNAKAEEEKEAEAKAVNDEQEDRPTGDLQESFKNKD